MGLFDDIFKGIPSIAGSILSGVFSSKNQKSANRTNLMQQQMANQANVDLWREQSKYNSPVEQMKRLSEAGLNPQLAYGNLNQSFASPAPTMQAAQVAPIPAPDFGQMFRDFATFRQNLKLAKAQERKIQNEADNEEIKSLLIDAQALHSRALAANEEWVYQQRTRLQDTYDEIVKEQLNQVRHQNLGSFLNNVLTYDKRNLLLKEIKIADATLTREQAIAKMWKAGINPNSQGMDKLLNILQNNPQQLRTILEQLREAGVGLGADIIYNQLMPNIIPKFFNQFKNHLKNEKEK